MKNESQLPRNGVIKAIGWTSSLKTIFPITLLKTKKCWVKFSVILMLPFLYVLPQLRT